MLSIAVNFDGFCRAISAVSADMRCLSVSVCVSVCLSVTFVYSDETNKH